MYEDVLGRHCGLADNVIFGVARCETQILRQGTFETFQLSLELVEFRVLLIPGRRISLLSVEC
jgi:hypothetical protein